MFRELETAGDVVDADEVEVAAGGEGGEVAVEENDGDAGFAEGDGDLAVGLFLAGHEFVGGEEDAGDAALDELAAELLGLLQAEVGILAGLVGAAPDEAVVVHAGEAGEFAADELEDLGIAKSGDEEGEELGGDAGFGLAAGEGAGAGAAFQEALGGEFAEGAGDGGAGDSEAADELGFAGHAAVGAVAAGEDLFAEFAGDFGKADGSLGLHGFYA
jgi:hypothetical protein